MEWSAGMHTHRRWILAGIAATAMPIWTATAAATVLYSLTDLGTLGGPISLATGINTAGEAVGWSYTPGGDFRAFSWDGQALVDIGTLGGTSGRAFGVNAAGEIVGSSTTSVATRAFLYAAGVMTDLGTLGGTNSEARAINDIGQVVGSASTAGDTATHAFVYNGGTMTDLGTLGGTTSAAYGVNDAGEVVGFSDTVGDASTHAFLYSGGSMIDLGTLGGSQSYAFGINNAGVIVGQANTAGDSATHAFVDQGGVMLDLGTLGGAFSYAQAINDAGQIVGASQDATISGFNAFIDSGGMMTDLNSVVAFNPLGLHLLLGASLNSAGQIVGVAATPRDEDVAFMLTPTQSVGSTTSTTSTTTSTTSTSLPAGADITVARFRQTGAGDRDTGSIAVSGDFLTAPPAGGFGASGGISVRVRAGDGLQLDYTFVWTAAECTTSRGGTIRCKSTDRGWTGSFRPRRATPALYRFMVAFRRLGIPGPFQSGVTVDVADLSSGTEYEGAIVACVTGTASMTCRAL